MQRVFVSYRRDDTAREAHVLKAILEERLADVAVFIDTDDIAGGAEWQSTLRMELERAGAVIALIGPDWRHGAGTIDRLIDEADWVRQELELALSAKRGKVLPVVVEDARDVFQDLPSGLAGLAELQTKPLSSSHWLDDVHAIAVWVADTLGADGKPLGLAFPRPDEIKQLFPALNPTEIDSFMASGGLSGWSTRDTVVPNANNQGVELYKVFEFRDFRHAFRFMCRVAAKAEEVNQHPDWHNIWSRVHVSQRTWDAGHVLTVLDFQMAAYMNKAAAEVGDLDSVPWPP